MLETKRYKPHFFLVFTMAMLLCCFICDFTPEVLAEKNGGNNPVFKSSFDKSFTSDVEAAPQWVFFGGAHIADGVVGGALSLGKAEYLTLDVRDILRGDEGSIMFWMRPHWEKDNFDSHTLVSMSWGDGRGGYLVISRGWWEPKGSRLTYFVSNNQDYVNVAKEIRFDKEEWTHIACTWKAGHKGFGRLYVNGLLAAESKRNAKMGNLPLGRLFLGGDQGTNLGQNRWADSDFDEITFYNEALTSEKILNEYETLQKPRAVAHNNSDGQMIETRAIFDEGTGWQTEEGAKRIINKISRAGFNLYVPCVWHGMGARYPTKKVATEGDYIFRARDPLERLISIAHEQGVQVHPWFTVALRQRDLFPEFSPEGTPTQAFDLHRPGFRQFIADLIREVAEKYPVDGINLDFVRTMGVCHCDKCISEYRDKYGRDLVADASLNDANGVLKVASFQEWQAKAVEDIIREISSSVKKVRPLAIISVDGHPTPYASAEGREEIQWVELGLVDYIFDMAYGDVPDVETPHLVRTRLNEPNRLIIMINNYNEHDNRLVSKNPYLMMSSISYIRNRWGNGIGVYLYSMLSDEQVEALSKGIFKTKAVPATTYLH
jgi:hypothetical protein